MNPVRHPSFASAARRPRYLSIVPPSSQPPDLPTREALDALLCAVARQDRQAFAVLFKHVAPRLKAYLARSGSPEGQAEELMQEAMVSVWRKSAQFDPRQAGAMTWIFTIARHLRVDQLRRLGPLALPVSDDDPRRAPDAADDGPGPDEALRTRRREEEVRAAIGQLAPEQARVLRLSYYEELPHVRIAQTLGLPLGTVKSRVRLAVQNLRRLLDGIEP